MSQIYNDICNAVTKAIIAYACGNKVNRCRNLTTKNRVGPDFAGLIVFDCPLYCPRRINELMLQPIIFQISI